MIFLKKNFKGLGVGYFFLIDAKKHILCWGEVLPYVLGMNKITPVPSHPLKIKENSKKFFKKFFLFYDIFKKFV